MDHGGDVAVAAAEDALVLACYTPSAMQVSVSGPVLCSVGMSNETEGCLGDSSVTAGRSAAGHDGSRGQFPPQAGDSLPSNFGGVCSTVSIDTITVVASCVDTPMSMSRDEEVPTPPLLSSKHGKFKKSLEDRFRGQGMERLSPANAGSLSPAGPGVRKLLHVECETGGRGEGDSDRKSRSVDDSDRRSRSMDEGETRGIRSNSFDPGTIAAGTLNEDSPLDLSRSATGTAGIASSFCAMSTGALTDRDVCRSLFEARARERHLRKRSESEENIRWQHDGRAAVAAAVAAAIPRSAALGRLCCSDAQIDRSGREIAEGVAAGFARFEAGHDVAHGAAAAGGSQQLALAASAHFTHRHKQHRQKSSSPSAGRSLQQRRSPKAYGSLDDGSASVQSDDDGRPTARSSSGSSHSLSTATTVRPSSTEGAGGSVSMLSPSWRLTPPPYQASGSAASVASDGTGSPIRHSPGARAASADDAGSAAAAGSLDDPASADSPGSAAARLHFCHVCDRSFSRSDMLTRHVRLHTGLKPYECQLCGQLFSRSDHLSTHQRTHTGERPYRCPHCPYAACRRDMITRHLRVHGRSSSGGGSSEDDVGCGLIASATHAAAVAAAAAATTATASNDVKAKRRRLLQRGPWSSGSSGGSAAAAGDGSSSWDSSSYSFGSSSIESSCGSGSMDVAGAAAAAAAAAYGLGGNSVGSGGSAWLHAPRIDPSRIWRWSSNGSSGSSSSGLGLSLGCSSPDVGGSSSSGGGGGRSNAAAATAASTTALPPFADSWADACDRAGLLGEAGAVMAGRQQQTAATATLPSAALERSIASCSVVTSKLSPSAPVWASAAMMSFGYGRTLAAGPMPAAAAAALLCATQPQALAFLTSTTGDSGSGGIDRSHAVAPLASSSGADTAGSVSAGGGGGGSSGQSLTSSNRSRLNECSSAAAVAATAVGTMAKERKSLVRQDASMEQEDESPPLSATDAAPASACTPPVLVLPPLPQQQLHKCLPASGWHDYSQVSRSAAQPASLAGLSVTTASVASLTVPRLVGTTATSTGGGGEGGLTAPRQSSLSDELGKVTMTE